jgi:outer membrane autotransporter protein
VFQAGVYGSHRFGAAYVAGSIAYAWYDMRTDRTVTVAGIDVLRANFDAHNIGARLEAGYRILTPMVGITPYIAGQVQNFRTPRYSEAAVIGNNTFALTFNDRSVTATRFELGSWFDKLIAMNRGDAIMLRGRAAWAHDDGGNGGLNAAFQTLPGAAFTVNGAAAPRNLALLSSGGEYRFANGLSVGGRFDGELANRGQTYAGTGTARYTW